MKEEVEIEGRLKDRRVGRDKRKENLGRAEGNWRRHIERRRAERGVRESVRPDLTADKDG